MLQWIVFLPNMCHFTKNIATSLELSSSKNSKRNLMYGKVPVNMGCQETSRRDTANKRSLELCASIVLIF